MGAGPGEYFLTGARPSPQQMNQIAAPYNAWHGVSHMPGATWAQESIKVNASSWQSG